MSVYGISECSTDLPRLQHIKNDLDATTALFNKSVRILAGHSSRNVLYLVDTKEILHDPDLFLQS